MFLLVLTMSKRIKYFISSLIGALAFYLYLGLPVESKYYGLILMLVICGFLFLVWPWNNF